MKRRWWLLCLLLLGSCAGQTPTEQAVEALPAMSWPAPPAAPRIQLVRSFSGPEDLGFQKSFFSQLGSLLAGPEEQRMIRPYAVAAAEGRLAVADPDAPAVHLFDLEDETYRRLDKAGKQAFSSPIAVVFGDGRLYVADSELNQVFVLDGNLDPLQVLTGFQRPTGLAFDPHRKRLYVTDTLTHQVLAFDPTGQRLFTIGERGERDDQFNFPSHLAFARDRLMVNDTLNFRIQIFDPDGRHRLTFGKHGDASGYFTQSKGLALDSDGHIYVADALANRVQIFDQTGRFLLEFGSGGEAPGEFRMPAGLAANNDTLYLADSYNQRIQVFRYLREE